MPATPHVSPRRARLLDGIDLAIATGLEIGPLTGAIVPKAGTRVLYADQMDTAGLRAKYAGHADVDPERIAEVDIVWNERPLAECLPAGTVLDYVVASHVIEHVPDIVGWLRQIAAVLRPGGRLCLVIPDKCFSFDYLREPSRLSELVEAHLLGNRTPTLGQVFDHMAGTVEIDVAAAWRGPLDPAALRHHQTPQHALHITRAVQAGAVVDVHAWVFTPASVLALFADLAMLGLLDFACAGFDDTPPGALDMQLVLRRLPDGADPAEARDSFLAAADWPRQLADAGAARRIVATLRAELAEAVATAAALRAELAAQQAAAAALRAEMAAVQAAEASRRAEIAALRHSTSWRLTAPLRALRRLGG